MKVSGITKITDRKVLSAIEDVMDRESWTDFFALYREIAGMNFAIWCNNHFGKRAYQRGYLGDKRVWLDKLLDLITADEETFWTILDCREVFLVDEDSAHAYALRLKSHNVNGVIVNSIYVKTFMSISGRHRVYANTSDNVFGYSMSRKTLTENPDYVTQNNGR
ncbi:MAG: hypothetical protein Q4G33_06505 [bacterium]|nr:hypothetical protein [bacterium]